MTRSPVLIHARAPCDPDKHSRATGIMRVLWKNRTGRLSQQVLQEFYVTVTRKLKPGLTPEAARRDVRDFLAWDPKPVTAGS